MSKEKSSRPRLVEVAELPKAVRRGVYTELVQEFAQSDMRIAKLEGAKPTSAVSVKKAIAALELSGVSVVTSRGEVYLQKR